MKLSKEEVAIIEAHRKNKPKPRNIFVDNIDADGLRLFTYVATDQLPKFELPKSWFVKKDEFDPYCSEINEDDEFFNTKYYIQAYWGYSPGDVSVSQYNHEGEKLIDWLYKNKKKPFLRGVWLSCKT